MMLLLHGVLNQAFTTALGHLRVVPHHWLLNEKMLATSPLGRPDNSVDSEMLPWGPSNKKTIFAGCVPAAANYPSSYPKEESRWKKHRCFPHFPLTGFLPYFHIQTGPIWRGLILPTWPTGVAWQKATYHMSSKTIRVATDNKEKNLHHPIAWSQK